MKLKKVNEGKEKPCCPLEQALEQSEISKENMEDVMKLRRPEKLEPVSDIDSTIEKSKLEAPKKTKFNIIESFLKDGFKFLSLKESFRVSCKDRGELGKLVEFLKENKIQHTIKRSMNENYRYNVFINGPKTLKEGATLKEQVSDEAYEIAYELLDRLEALGKHYISLIAKASCSSNSSCAM